MAFSPEPLADLRTTLAETIRHVGLTTHFLFGSQGVNAGLHTIADKIDGTVNGVDKSLSDRWQNALFKHAGLERPAEGELEISAETGKQLADTHNDWLDDASVHKLNGLTRIEAQKAVLDKIEAPKPSSTAGVAAGNWRPKF
ncbi:MAG: hypothetical protein DI551_05120 [Micavibrio aeruginosavorus]|uniref:Uncharacterized protein n=1 Tax=Micavibrio aeruginosavorus TaxID=349221 RepID=A0A2W5MYQ7_9BACT|nr:MAG: hypothetical protein DI551_05120 [Micavibrio aeruginosavorus]